MVWALFLSLFNGFQQRRFGIFPAAVSQWLGHVPAGVLPFRMRVPNTFFLSLAWWLAGFQVLVLRCGKVCLAWGNLFSLFLVGSKSNVSAVFWLRFRMVWALFLFFLMGSKSDVSAFFRLRFGNGLGAKPAGVLPFALCLAGRNLSQPFFLCF